MSDTPHAHCPRCAAPYMPWAASDATSPSDVIECVCGVAIQYAGDRAQNCAVLYAVFDPRQPAQLEPVQHCRLCHGDPRAAAPEQLEHPLEHGVPASSVDTRTAPSAARAQRKPAGGGIVV